MGKISDELKFYENLKTLCEISGVSGREQKVREFIIDSLEKSAAQIDVTVDNLGNVIAHVKGEKRADKKLLIAAHMDEVGFIITGITADGFLRFDAVGGILPAVVYGRRVCIGGIVGVIAGKAFHQCDKKERKTAPALDKLVIDIGACSKEEAERLVKLGDVATFASDYCELNPEFGDLIKAPAFDDRIGCMLLLEIASCVPCADITLAFTVQEEVGLRGAKTATASINPDNAIIIDATTAADVAGVSGEKRVCVVGGGPVIPFMDGRTLYDSELYRLALDTAAEHGIIAQTKTMIAGGTDAGAVQTSGKGVKVVGISLPCRYIHSASCVLSKSDISGTFELVSRLIEPLTCFGDIG